LEDTRNLLTLSLTFQIRDTATLPFAKLIAMTEAAKFLEARTFAVAGASSQKHKYGYKVFKALIDGGFDAYAINPNVPVIDGQPSYASIHKLPVKIEALSVVTPPAATRLIVADAINAGIRIIWMQPGAEDESAIYAAKAAGITVIADGSCLLVSLALK
jgi:predicted CoA-binding protein